MDSKSDLDTPYWQAQESPTQAGEKRSTSAAMQILKIPTETMMPPVRG